MLAAVLLVALEDSVIGREIFLPPAATVEIEGKGVREAKGGVWRVVGKAGERYRIVADHPARVGLYPAEPGMLEGPLNHWMRSRVVRQGEGWWNKYVGKIFCSYGADYSVSFRGDRFGMAKFETGGDHIRVEAAIPLERAGTVYLDGASLDTMFSVESKDRVIFVVSFVSGRNMGWWVSESGDSEELGPDREAVTVLEMPALNMVNGRFWTSIELAGEWDAQRHFSEKSLEAELGYSRKVFDKKFERGARKGMSKWELAWLYGWPHMALSPEQALKEDIWSYNNIPFEATYEFKRGKLVSWQIPMLP